MNKTIWIIEQYSSTPETGMAGRHYNLAKEMVKSGIDVYIITSANHHLLRQKPSFKGNISIEERKEGFKFVWIKLPNYSGSQDKKRVLGWFLFSHRLLKLKQIKKPDVVFYSSPSLIGFLSALKIAKRNKAKLVFEVRDIWPLTLMELGGYSSKHPFIRYMQWVEDKAYKESDLVISNLKNSVNHMVNRGMKKEKFLWVPNGVSYDEISKNEPLNSEIEKLIPKDKFIIGYTGSFGIANALDSLLQAAIKLKEKKDILFVLVGAGQQEQKLKKIVKDNSLTNVLFVSSIPKRQIQSMLSYFNLCYIGLTKDPLFRFGVSPNKLFDYLYANKPIIYAIDSGSYKPVEDIGVGLSIKPQDSEDIKRAILYYYSKTEEELIDIGSKGRKAVLEFYEYEILTKRMLSRIF